MPATQQITGTQGTGQPTGGGLDQFDAGGGCQRLRGYAVQWIQLHQRQCIGALLQTAAGVGVVEQFGNMGGLGQTGITIAGEWTHSGVFAQGQRMSGQHEIEAHLCFQQIDQIHQRQPVFQIQRMTPYRAERQNADGMPFGVAQRITRQPVDLVLAAPGMGSELGIAACLVAFKQPITGDDPLTEGGCNASRCIQRFQNPVSQLAQYGNPGTIGMTEDLCQAQDAPVVITGQGGEVQGAQQGGLSALHGGVICGGG